MAVLQSDGVNHTSDLILRRNGTEGLRLTSSTVQLSSINNGPLAGFRNAIINGNFDIWQRGTSFTGNQYGADRWLSTRNGSTHTVTRQSFAPGQTDVPGEPTYFSRTAVVSAAGANNFSLLEQRIEGVRTLAGQQITVSFWAKADASKDIALELSQAFGSGGTPSTGVTGIAVIKKTLTTTWQKITHTLTLPSISGKTIGTNNNDSLTFHIWFDAGSNVDARTDSLGQQSGTFDIAQVQVEAGPVATPFEYRPIGTELALCQRYYEQSDGTNVGGRVGWSGFATIGVDFYGTYYFKVQKRSAPTVIATNVDAVLFFASSGTILTDILGFREARPCTTTGGNGRFFSTFTASAEL